MFFIVQPFPGACGVFGAVSVTLRKPCHVGVSGSSRQGSRPSHWKPVTSPGAPVGLGSPVERIQSTQCLSME